MHLWAQLWRGKDSPAKVHRAHRREPADFYGLTIVVANGLEPGRK
jgi:hypothetical protein